MKNPFPSMSPREMMHSGLPHLEAMGRTLHREGRPMLTPHMPKASGPKIMTPGSVRLPRFEGVKVRQGGIKLGRLP